MTRFEFVKEFLNAFAQNISHRQRRKIGLKIGRNGEYRGRGYLWSLFAYNLVPCFKGEEAKIKYDEADKRDAVEIQYDSGLGHGDDTTEVLCQTFLTAEGVDRYGYPEFYIIGENFSWCYVITHEGDGDGPYFAYKP